MQNKNQGIDYDEARIRAATDLRHYWFSLAEAKARWKIPKAGIFSGIIGGKRKCFTKATLTKDKPQDYPDYKYLGTASYKDIKMVGGITEHRFDLGLIDFQPKDHKGERL